MVHTHERRALSISARKHGSLGNCGTGCWMACAQAMLQKAIIAAFRPREQMSMKGTVGRVKMKIRGGFVRINCEGFAP